MKNSKSIILTLILVGITVISFITCKRVPSKDELTNNNFNRSALTFRELTFLNPTALPSSITKIENKTLIYKRYNSNTNYSSNFLKLNNTEITEFIRQLTSYEIEPISFVIYLNKEIQPYHTISKDDITGMSFYTFNNGNIFHQLYIKQGDKYVIRDDYSFNANLHASNHMTFILKNIIPSNLNSKSYVCFDNSSINYKLTSSKDHFFIKEAAFLKKWIYTTNKQLSRTKLPDGGTGLGDGCSTQLGCGSGLSWLICAYGNYQYECTPLPTCSDNAAYTVLSDDNNYDQQDLDDAFDFDLHYALRDNVLSGSTVGEKYIMYFYAIGDYISGDVDVSFAYDCFDVLPEMNAIITTLLSPSGHENEVLLTSPIAAKLNIILSNLRGLSTDADMDDVINDLQNDLDYFTGKTVSEVLAFF